MLLLAHRVSASLTIRAGRGDLAQLWDAACEQAGPGSAAAYPPAAGAALPGGVLAHAYGGELMDEGAPSRLGHPNLSCSSPRGDLHGANGTGLCGI